LADLLHKWRKLCYDGELRMETRSTTTTDATDLRAFAIEAAQLLHDRHCEDITLLDVRGLSQVCDYVLIANGTSDKQMKSVAGDLKDLGDERGHAAFRTNRDTATTWVIVDFVDVVVHLFEPSMRSYYDIENLWSDAKVVPWQREDDAQPTDG
jgi:ribosome-associated protein